MSKRLFSSAFVATMAMAVTALFTGVQQGHIQTSAVVTMMGG